MDFKVCHHGLQGMPSWTSRYAIMDFKVCYHGLQDMPSWSSRYAIMEFKVCHHGLQGMPSWTSRYAIMDFKVSHHGLQGMPSWTSYVSSRVAFTRRESFNNCSPQSGTAISKLFLTSKAEWYRFLISNLA